MSTVGDVGEFPLIQELTRELRFTPGSGVEVGPGDDAAVLAPHPGARIVATADMLVEGVHFTGATPAFFTGWRALAASLSDLAAMGATARWFLVTMALPRTFPLRRVRQFYEGMRALADLHDVTLVGGDVTSSPGPAVFDVLGLGELLDNPALTRGAALPGDWVACTGHPGDSAAGLALLLAAQAVNPSLVSLDDTSGNEGAKVDWKKRWPRYGQACLAALEGIDSQHQQLLELFKHHLAPLSRLRELETLLARFQLHAVNDISDGVASEANEIATASHVSLVLDAEALPISQPAKLAGRVLGRDAVDWFLNGGEDYELLFTCAPVPGYRAGYVGPLSHPPVDVGGQEVPVTIVGQAEPADGDGPGVWLKRGAQKTLLPASGYAHFRGR